MDLKLYKIRPKYINYLSSFEKHLFHNKQSNQKYERKYIGIILRVNDFNYFVPLSSFKEKHKSMKENIDFIKIKDYAVININNMFPVPNGNYEYVDISKEKDPHYRALLQAEYRIIKAKQKRIVRNAAIIYNHKIEKGNTTQLAKRCNDFVTLERACVLYEQGK